MKARSTVYCSMLILLLSLFSFSSVLSDMADTLTPGTWAMMPENAGLDNLSMPYSLFYYNDSGCWDPVNKRIRWIGAGGTCCTNGQYYLLTYQAADNTWTIANAPFSGSGHGFDGNTMDPATGIHYFYRFHTPGIYKLSGTNWSQLPDIPFSASASNAPEWFPEINNGKGGLVHVGNSGNIAWFDGAKWTGIPKPAQVWGDRAMFSQYNPVHKLVWLGGGPNNLRVHYKLDAQLKLTRLKDAPLDMRMSKTLHSVDPVSGMCIVCTVGGSAWWEFNPVTDTWRQLTFTQGTPPNSIAMQVPVPEYGVILYYRHYHAQRDLYIYKHSKPSLINGKGVAGNTNKGIEVSVLPNPFNAITKIAVSCQLSAVSNYSLTIFDITGKCIKHLSLKARESFIWNPIGIPNGIYLLKATAGNHTVAKKLFLQR